MPEQEHKAAASLPVLPVAARTEHPGTPPTDQRAGGADPQISPADGPAAAAAPTQAQTDARQRAAGVDTASVQQQPSGNGDASAGNAAAAAVDPARPIQDKLLEGKIIEAIRTVYDPEIPVNIYDLGLIYQIDIDPQRNVKVRMTLTAPGCPVAGSLVAEVASRIEQVSEVASADVELVWDPPWDRSRMSESALLDLGLL